MSDGLQTVHVRVNDAATGQPTPCRVRFTGPDGKYYAPFGRLTEFAVDMAVDVGGNLLLGNKQYAHIDGTCEIQLPAGVPLTIEITKGPEYRPLRSQFTLPPGKLALRFELERWIDLRAQGWYSGDVRSHFLTPHAALLEAAAEDVAVVNLLLWECRIFGEAGRQYPSILNIEAFSGQRPALEMPGHLVVVNTLNIHPALGRLILLNCHRIVYPLTCGSPEGQDDWALADWCAQCHRKGGLVVGDNFFGHCEGHPHGELLADLILGKIDALLMGDLENPEADAKFGQESVLKEWYGLLDCGFHVPVVGGSGKDCNLCPLGCTRTYARLAPGEEFNYKSWIEAVRAGRTFVTNGPLLSFRINDQNPGAVIELPSSDAAVRVRAEARSLVPFCKLRVVANGAVVASAEPTGSPLSATVEADVALPEGGWLTAQCWGAWDEALEGWIGAQSSPIYVSVKGRQRQPDPRTIAAFAGYLHEMLNWVQHKARCDDRQRQRLAGIFHDARQELLRRSPEA